MPDAYHPTYPWPASAITPEDMSLLYAARERSSPRVPITRLLAEAVRTAIEANRHLKEAFTQLREVSQTALQDSLPGMSRCRSNLPRVRLIKTVPKGA